MTSGTASKWAGYLYQRSFLLELLLLEHLLLQDEDDVLDLVHLLLPLLGTGEPPSELDLGALVWSWSW